MLNESNIQHNIYLYNYLLSNRLVLSDAALGCLEVVIRIMKISINLQGKYIEYIRLHTNDDLRDPYKKEYHVNSIISLVVATCNNMDSEIFSDVNIFDMCNVLLDNFNFESFIFNKDVEKFFKNLTMMIKQSTVRFLIILSCVSHVNRIGMFEQLYEINLYCYRDIICSMKNLNDFIVDNFFRINCCMAEFINHQDSLFLLHVIGISYSANEESVRKMMLLQHKRIKINEALWTENDHVLQPLYMESVYDILDRLLNNPLERTRDAIVLLKREFTNDIQSELEIDSSIYEACMVQYSWNIKKMRELLLMNHRLKDICLTNVRDDKCLDIVYEMQPYKTKNQIQKLSQDYKSYIRTVKAKAVCLNIIVPIILTCIILTIYLNIFIPRK
jgi:hypothetical protein